MSYKRSSLRLLMTAFVVGLFLFSTTITAEITYPVDDNSFIIDDVGVLNSTEEGELEQLSIDLSDGWGTDIVVVLIESTNNYTTENDTNMSLAQYTIQLFEEWGVGNQEWQDGVLIVLATNQTGSWEWSYEYGFFWQEEYSYVFEEWDDRIPESVDDDMDAGNWTDALYYLVDDLALSIDDFWYENDGWVDPPAADFTTTPTLDGQDTDSPPLTAGESLITLVCCFGGLGIVGLVVFGIARSGGGGGGGSGGRWNRNGGWGNNQYGYPNDVGYQENNYYIGNGNNAPVQNHQPPSGGSSPSRSSGGGSSRGSSGGSSSRSSGGSSRGSNGGGSSRSSSGSSSRGGGSSRRRSSGGGSSSRRSGGGRRGK